MACFTSLRNIRLSVVYISFSDMDVLPLDMDTYRWDTDFLFLGLKTLLGFFWDKDILTRAYAFARSLDH